MDRETERELVEQWEAAGRVLAEVRARELSELTDAEALDAAEALLALVDDLPPKDGTSGLGEQQRPFASILDV